MNCVTARDLGRRKAAAFSAVTAFPALQIQAIGPLGFYKITVAAGGDITLGGDNVDGTTTLYTIDLSTPAAGIDTFGELKDSINGSTGGHFRCYPLGVLPSESTDNTLAALSATHLKGSAAAGVAENGLTLYIDQAVLLDVGFAITNDKFTSQPINGSDGFLVGFEQNAVGNVRNIVNELLYINVNLTQTNAGSTKVYSVDDRPGVNSATLLYSNAYVSATAEEHPSSSGAYSFVALPGQRLCVKFDAVDTAATACDVRATGLTWSIDGKAINHGANYTGCV